jgi:hypothetical protein
VLYTQTFEISINNNKTIIISASQFLEQEENTVFGLSDNQLVTTNIELATNLNL